MMIMLACAVRTAATTECAWISKRQTPPMRDSRHTCDDKQSTQSEFDDDTTQHSIKVSSVSIEPSLWTQLSTDSLRTKHPWMTRVYPWYSNNGFRHKSNQSPPLTDAFPPRLNPLGFPWDKNQHVEASTTQRWHLQSLEGSMRSIFSTPSALEFWHLHDGGMVGAAAKAS